MLKNTESSYGTLSKALHWLVALVVFTMFAVGFWMVELDYYSDWYKTAPHYHKSIGLLLSLVVIFRLFWRMINKRPEPLATHSRLEIFAAHVAHLLLYLALFAIFISGYLISTADGRGIEVFNWFTIPSAGEFIEQQEDIAGSLHKWLAYGLIALVSVHALAAIKHHFIDRDNTLKRML